MEINNIGDVASMLKRHKGKLFSVFSVLIIITLIVVFTLPPVYKSSATILIEQQEIPEDLVRSTITSYADQRIQVISQRVMTRSNLLGIIEKYDLYQEKRKDEVTEVVLEEMREDINLNTISADVIDPRSGRATVATIAFSLSFEYMNPKFAQKVANELATLYMNENLKDRTKSVVEASDFINDETEKLAQEIEMLEQKLEKFKQDNIGMLPEMMAVNIQVMDRTEREIQELERQISVLEEKKIYLTSELVQINPNSSLFSETGERILSPNDRLRALETKLITASSVYSESHPDVKRLKREYELLRAELNLSDSDSATTQSRTDLERMLAQLNAEYDKLETQYSGDHPTLQRVKNEIEETKTRLKKHISSNSAVEVIDVPDNPAFIRIKTDLEAADVELSSLKKHRRELKNKITTYENRIAQSPAVEKVYKALSRDFENAWVQYRELKAKQLDAKMAQSLESERKGERFTLIEPALLPEKPVKPNRMAFFILGGVLSVGIAFGVVILSESINDSVRGSTGVIGTINMEPLVTIPYIETMAEVSDHRFKVRLLGIMFVVTAIGITAAFHWLYMPLDVFWYAGLRRLDL